HPDGRGAALEQERRDRVICDGWTPGHVVSEKAITAYSTDFQCNIWRCLCWAMDDLELRNLACRRHYQGHKFSAALSLDNCADNWRLLLHAVERRKPAWLYLRYAFATENQRKRWSADSISNNADALPGFWGEMET